MDSCVRFHRCALCCLSHPAFAAAFNRPSISLMHSKIMQFIVWPPFAIVVGAAS